MTRTPPNLTGRRWVIIYSLYITYGMADYTSWYNGATLNCFFPPKTFFQVDSLIEAFGTNKQKRALSSRRNNQVADDSLQKAVAQAASNIIDQKGLKG